MTTTWLPAAPAAEPLELPDYIHWGIGALLAHAPHAIRWSDLNHGKAIAGPGARKWGKHLQRLVAAGQVAASETVVAGQPVQRRPALAGLYSVPASEEELALVKSAGDWLVASDGVRLR